VHGSLPRSSPASMPHIVVMPGVSRPDRAVVAPGTALGSVPRTVDARQGRAHTRNNHQEPRDAPITAVRGQRVFS
jgi:hypothetical protein